jgi:cytochrome c-type biogenesis protein CcmH/NrfG
MHTQALWEDVIAKSPGKARGHYNLGKEYENIGRLEDAVREYRLLSN